MWTTFVAAKRYAWALALCTLAAGQGASPNPGFWDRANLELTDGTVSVRANDPRPLAQAIEAIRQEYGWEVDYEDPPYESQDLADNTDPRWRIAHPQARGVTRVGGGLFATRFDLAKDMRSGSPEEERVLGKVVADYNASGNPGRFMLKKEGVDRFAIVGTGIRDSSGNARPVTPVLDGQVSLPPQERTVIDTIKLVSQAISAKSSYKVDIGTVPVNLAFQTSVKVGGDNVSGRALLAQIAATTRFPLVWKLLFDADAQCYFINMEIATLGPSAPLRDLTRPVSK